MAYDRINPRELGQPRGFTHGMLAPAGSRVLFVAGQDAAEPEGPVGTDDFVEQFRIALAKTLAVVRAAGAGPEAIGRMTLYVTDVATYRAERAALGAAYRELMGKHFPAMALVEVRALVDPRAKVEIEATAAVPDGGPLADIALPGGEGLP
ncbi:MAG TPA: RidA family protein [Thermoanaerobaculia bacterium]|nr:RidA family protein [Thermoanaerobaculia bacterium]